MALRAKGLSLDFSGFRQANAMTAETGRVQAEGLLRLGAGIGGAIGNVRSDQKEKAAKAERAEDKAYLRAKSERGEAREDDRMAATAKNQERDDAYRRDKDALSWLEEQHAGAFTQLQEVMQHGQADKNIQTSDAWKSARAQAAARERELAGKVAAVRARLTGMQPADVTTPAPVQPTYGLGATSSTTDRPQETDEARVTRLGAAAARLRELAKNAKGAAAALYGGLAGQAEAEFGLAKRGVVTREKDAKKSAQADAAYRDLTPIAQRAREAGVPDETIASVLGAVKAGNANYLQAKRALEAEVTRLPESVAAKEVAREKAQATAAKATGQRTDAQKDDAAFASTQKKNARHEQEGDAKKEREAIGRFMDEMNAVDKEGKPLPPRLDMLSDADADTILYSRNAPPAVVKLAEQVRASRKGAAPVVEPRGLFGGGSAAPSAVPTWERAPGGGFRKKGG